MFSVREVLESWRNFTRLCQSNGENHVANPEGENLRPSASLIDATDSVPPGPQLR